MPIYIVEDPDDYPLVISADSMIKALEKYRKFIINESEGNLSLLGREVIEPVSIKLAAEQIL